MLFCELLIGHQKWCHSWSLVSGFQMTHGNDDISMEFGIFAMLQVNQTKIRKTNITSLFAMLPRMYSWLLRSTNKENSELYRSHQKENLTRSRNNSKTVGNGDLGLDCILLQFFDLNQPFNSGAYLYSSFPQASKRFDLFNQFLH